MTAIVGVWCKDGVVLGTDSSATFSAGRQPTIEQLTDKLVVVGDACVFAGTGSVGLGQRFAAIAQGMWDDKKFQGGHLTVAKALTKATIEDFSATYAPKEQFGALMAFRCDQKHYLCEFQVADLQPEFKDEKLWYASMGSGQAITDPFLGFIREVFWGEGVPNVREAAFAVTWALDHAVNVNPGGINHPVRLVLEKASDGKLHARKLEEAELGEHRQNIEAAKERLRSFRKEHSPGSPVAEPPKLEGTT